MRLAQLTVLGLSLVACRGTDNKGDDTPDVDAPIGGSVRVQDVQNESMPVGTVVELKGVIVTAIDSFGARTGDLWVQDPAGGEFSGVKVFGAPLEQIASLVPGDIVTISNAEKDEFALTDDTTGRTVTEIKPASGGAMLVTKTGTGPVPTPVTVDAKAIEELADEAARDAEWEKWEGVLINVTNVRQFDEYLPFSSTSSNPDQFEFNATGGIAVQSVLADLGAPAIDTCYAGITGIGDYFFNYLLLPTASDKLVVGGTGCTPIVEPLAASISQVQAGTATGKVKLTDVFVTAISFNKKNLWVSTSLTAGGDEGVFVFRGGGANLPANIAVGAKVDIVGNVVEHNNDVNGDTVTQLANGVRVTFKEAPAGALVPVSNMQAAQLMAAGTGEPFESVLVTLTNVKVMAVGDQANFGVGSLKQGTTTFLSDDDVFRLPAAELNKCYASITGLWTYQVFDNAYGFLPLAVGTGTGTCP